MGKNAILKKEKTIMENKETKWTTLSIDKELRPLLDAVMFKMGKKLSYNQIITKLAKEYLEDERAN